jgi:hypothetical protein
LLQSLPQSLRTRQNRAQQNREWPNAQVNYGSSDPCDVFAILSMYLAMILRLAQSDAGKTTRAKRRGDKPLLTPALDSA